MRLPVTRRAATSEMIVRATLDSAISLARGGSASVQFVTCFQPSVGRFAGYVITLRTTLAPSSKGKGERRARISPGMPEEVR